MSLTPLNNRQEAKLDPQLEYRALVRSLKYPKGFGLLFVQCSPPEGARLIAKVQKDLPKKRIEILSLTDPIENLYEKVDTLYRKQPIDILFVKGIEHSLYDYEKNRLWDDNAQKISYSETGAPRLLQHLNLSRERFHESFPFCFVFLIPYFALKYLIRRAPDFFDWNSGVLEFSMEREQLRQESQRPTIEQLLRKDPQNFSPDKCRKNLLEIQALIGEPYQTEAHKADLFFEQGRLFEITGEWEVAIASYDKALDIESNNHETWKNRGNALFNLGRYQEALNSYDKALQIKPDYHEALYGRSSALFNLGHYQEATISYDRALAIKLGPGSFHAEDIALQNLGHAEKGIISYSSVSSQYQVWRNRGNAMLNLGRNEEAIISYNNALEFKLNDHEVRNNRGIALRNLGRYEEAIASYNEALEVKPDYPDTLYNKACCYALQANVDDAIANLSRAISLDPDKYRNRAKTDLDLALLIRDNEQFKALVAG